MLFEQDLQLREIGDLDFIWRSHLEIAIARAVQVLTIAVSR
jgi:hypothetical protein